VLPTLNVIWVLKFNTIVAGLAKVLSDF
jgi:hypothetical protein